MIGMRRERAALISWLSFLNVAGPCLNIVTKL
jgi:hypothetical protein